MALEDINLRSKGSMAGILITTIHICVVMFPHRLPIRVRVRVVVMFPHRLPIRVRVRVVVMFPHRLPSLRWFSCFLNQNYRIQTQDDARPQTERCLAERCLTG